MWTVLNAVIYFPGPCTLISSVYRLVKFVTFGLNCRYSENGLNVILAVLNQFQVLVLGVAVDHV